MYIFVSYIIHPNLMKTTTQNEKESILNSCAIKIITIIIIIIT